MNKYRTQSHFLRDVSNELLLNHIANLQLDNSTYGQLWNWRRWNWL